MNKKHKWRPTSSAHCSNGNDDSAGEFPNGWEGVCSLTQQSRPGWRPFCKRGVCCACVGGGACACVVCGDGADWCVCVCVCVCACVCVCGGGVVVGGECGQRFALMVQYLDIKPHMVQHSVITSHMWLSSSSVYRLLSGKTKRTAALGDQTATCCGVKEGVGFRGGGPWTRLGCCSFLISNFSRASSCSRCFRVFCKKKKSKKEIAG